MSDTYSGSHSPIENIIDTASVEKDIDINEILKQNNITKQTIEVVVHHHHHFDKHKNENDLKVKTPKQRPLRTSSSSNKSYSTSPSQNLSKSMFDPNTIIATSYYNKKRSIKRHRTRF